MRVLDEVSEAHLWVADLLEHTLFRGGVPDKYKTHVRALVDDLTTVDETMYLPTRGPW